jgi:hypothetical protein
MPTGYTACIEDGNPTFREFALRCARAFGALIHMRDEPLDKPLEPRKGDDTYYRKRLEEAKERLQEAKKVTLTKAKAYCIERFDKDVVEWTEREAERNRILAKYAYMTARVMSWKPPTPEHTGLRDFMLSQIKDSTKWLGEPRLYPVMMDPAEYRAREIREAADDIDRATKALLEEASKVASTNKWIKDLEASLD